MVIKMNSIMQSLIIVDFEIFSCWISLLICLRDGVVQLKNANSKAIPALISGEEQILNGEVFLSVLL